MSDLNTRLGYDHWFGQNPPSAAANANYSNTPEEEYGHGGYATFNDHNTGNSF